MLGPDYFASCANSYYLIPNAAIFTPPPRTFKPVGYCDHQCVSVCLSVHPHFLSTHYLINAQVEKRDMLQNYDPWVD